MELKYKKIGIVVKPHKDVAFYLKKAVQVLQSLKVEIFLEKIAAELLGEKSAVLREEIAGYADMIIVIGGDGTFLSVAKHAVEQDVPVAGFNLGALGFLTELKKERLEETIEAALNDQLTISERKLLQLHYKGETGVALNDVVVSKGNIARIIKLSLEIDGLYVADIKADGLIVSTPTGSTAYSLAAGGPIVTPPVDGVVVTPICPHSLTFRPFVIPAGSRVKVKLISEGTEVFITIDGQKVIPMHSGDYFETTVYSKKLKMVVSNNMNYFRLLNEKLNWGL
ncbi:MAG: NAD(+)/NADH kinase [Candidatus Aminicenantes bacterium]|nr:NAD(+)/NADH kinase [Candidatus Aminicenantes bacterium]